MIRECGGLPAVAGSTPLFSFETCPLRWAGLCLWTTL